MVLKGSEQQFETFYLLDLLCFLEGLPYWLQYVCHVLVFLASHHTFLITHLLRSRCSLNTHSCLHDKADKER